MTTKSKTNKISEKWDSLPWLNQEQVDYLSSRLIDYSLLGDIVKNSDWRISVPIRWLQGEIKSIQWRSIIPDDKVRYKIEKNTDSDWVFFSWINPEIKYLILVEWMTDFLSLRQYSTNIVWLFNATADWQLDIIKAMSLKYEIYFVPDNDEAWSNITEKLKNKWIKYNRFNLSDYWVKDVNELITSYPTGAEVIESILQESERPPSNIRMAISKAKEYKKLYEENDWRLGITTWIEELDWVLSGFIRGKVYLIMAYSNQGKSRFAYSLIRNIIEQKKKVFFYSLEVDAWMLIIEILWALYKKPKEYIVEHIDTFDLSKIEPYIEVYDSVRSLEWIETHITANKPDFAFIDFVQNIELTWDEYTKTTEIALRLQKLAILTGVTLINLSQVNNESRFLEGSQIMPKWSWALFASSDVIMSLWSKNWERYLTVAKNKFWRAMVNFLLEVDFATSTFKLWEENVSTETAGAIFSSKRRL